VRTREQDVHSQSAALGGGANDGMPEIDTRAALPKIPKVTITERVGSGASANVYIAVHQASRTRVAVKVLHSHLLRDQEKQQRFFHGAALNQSLDHPNVLEVLEVGTCEAGHFIVMEYLGGGDLNRRLEAGMHIQEVIKCVKDIARALDAAHEAGIEHCDVKPENIMFTAQGTVVLTDFGIADWLHDPQPARSESAVDGAEEGSSVVAPLVSGTPEYMSPERAAGRRSDGRSDLYSLGVVFYRMLTGDLPYHGETPLELSIKHLQEPIPKLPAHHSVFQGVIDTALAKRPEQRFANGAAFVDALEKVRTEGVVPAAIVKTKPITTQEIFAVAGATLATPFDPQRKERQTARRRRRQRLRVASLFVLLVLVATGAGYYSYERGLVSPELVLNKLGLGEDPAVALAWSEAQSLRQDPNQGLSAIVAAYGRVLELDAEHTGASDGMNALANDWATTIDEALQQGNTQLAQTRLVEAINEMPKDTRWIDLSAKLQDYQRADRIAQSTESLLASHGLSDVPSATAAIQSYQEVLRLAPTHANATNALTELAQHYTELAREAASKGEVGSAISLLDRAAAAQPDLAQLDDIRKLISQAENSRAEINDLLQQARRFRAENALITPAGQNAAELYHRVLAADPDNVIAAQGLNEVSSQVANTARQLLGDGNLTGAEELLGQATSAGLNADFLLDIRGRLESEQNRLTATQAHLAEATRLIALGFLTSPPVDNAVAHLREIQQLDPGNVEAESMLRSCADRLVSAAKEAREFGMFDSANQYLDLALTINPEVQEWVALREEWEAS